MHSLLQQADSASPVCCMLVTVPGSLTPAVQGPLLAAQLLVHQLPEGTGGRQQQTPFPVCGWVSSAVGGPACSLQAEQLEPMSPS